jgi:hypothetical protein
LHQLLQSLSCEEHSRFHRSLWQAQESCDFSNIVFFNPGQYNHKSKFIRKRINGAPELRGAFLRNDGLNRSRRD